MRLFKDKAIEVRVVLVLLCLSMLIFSSCTQAPATEEVSPESEVQQETEPPADTVEEESPQALADTEPPPTETTEPTPSPTTDMRSAQVVFISNRSGDENARQLHVLDLETNEITFLDTGMENLAYPTWSPDGTKILFVDVNNFFLYTINADGTNLTQITDFRANSADWSPDGLSIVFQSDHAGEPENVPDLYTMNLDGSGLTKIVENLTVPDYGPHWSLMGNLISFVSYMDGAPAIYTINPDGSALTRISGEDVTLFNAAISPSGNQFVFVVKLDAEQISKLFLYDVNDPESGLFQLTDEASSEDLPNWAPDGTKIVFNLIHDRTYDIWLVNVDGSGLTALTDDEYLNLFPDIWTP